MRAEGCDVMGNPVPLIADVLYAVESLDATVRSLRGLSGTDHLTRLLNRREGEKRLAEEAARVRRGGGYSRSGWLM